MLKYSHSNMSIAKGTRTGLLGGMLIAASLQAQEQEYKCLKFCVLQSPLVNIYKIQIAQRPTHPQLLNSLELSALTRLAVPCALLVSNQVY